MTARQVRTARVQRIDPETGRPTGEMVELPVLEGHAMRVPTTEDIEGDRVAWLTPGERIYASPSLDAVVTGLDAARASRTPSRRPDRVEGLDLGTWSGTAIPPLNANQRWGPRDHRLTGIKRDLRRAVVRACRSVALPTGAEFVEVTLWYRPRSGKGPDPSNLMPTVKVVTDALLPQPTINRSRTYTTPPAGYGLIEDDDRTRVSQAEPIVLSPSVGAIASWGVELRVWYPPDAEARPHDPFGGTP